MAIRASDPKTHPETANTEPARLETARSETSHPQTARPENFDAAPTTRQLATTPDQPQLVLTHEHRDSDDTVIWQLTARNGRVLGRSTGRFADEEAALADVTTTVKHSQELTLVVSHAEHRAGWIWRIDAARNRPVLHSHRAYERYDSCRRSGKRVLAALTALDPTPGPRSRSS